MGEANKSGPKKQGKSNRKFGRAARSPSMQRYNTTRRDLINKARHIARALRQRDKARRKRIEREYRKARNEDMQLAEELQRHVAERARRKDLAEAKQRLTDKGYDLDALERDNPFNAWMHGEGQT